MFTWHLFVCTVLTIYPIHNNSLPVGQFLAVPYHQHYDRTYAGHRILIFRVSIHRLRLNAHSMRDPCIRNKCFLWLVLRYRPYHHPLSSRPFISLELKVYIMFDLPNIRTVEMTRAHETEGLEEIP